jgi:hypothetical protein
MSRFGIEVNPMRTFLIALSVLLALPLRAAEPQQYPIRLDRPMKVGDRFVIKATASRTVDGLATPDRHTPKTMQERTEVELAGECEVLAVTDEGQIAKARVVLDRASMTLPTSAPDALERGTVLLVTIEKGRKSITGERVALSLRTTEALNLVLPMDEVTGTPESQRMFGTSQPQAVGATWKMDAKRCAARLQKVGLEIDPGELKGGCKLAQAGKLNGEPCVKILAKIRADHLMMSQMMGTPIPANWDSVDGSIDSTYTAVFPTDLTRHVLKWIDNARVTASFRIAPRGRMSGGQADLVVRVKRQVELTDPPAMAGGNGEKPPPSVVELEP